MSDTPGWDAIAAGHDIFPSDQEDGHAEPVEEQGEGPAGPGVEQHAAQQGFSEEETENWPGGRR